MLLDFISLHAGCCSSPEVSILSQLKKACSIHQGQHPSKTTQSSLSFQVGTGLHKMYVLSEQQPWAVITLISFAILTPGYCNLTHGGEQLRLEDEFALLVLFAALEGLVILPSNRLLALPTTDVANDVSTGRHIAFVGLAVDNVDHCAE